MSKSIEETKLCHTCNVIKPLSLFPKWRLKCKACKAAENGARLKQRYVNDATFAEATKQRAANWQRENAERANEYHRRRHAKKVAEGDGQYIAKMSAAQRRYRESDKGKAVTATRMKAYEESGQAKIWRKERRLKPESRVSQMIGSTRARALKANFDFALTFDDIYPAVAKGICQVTGAAFDLSVHPEHRTHPFAPSIDRINSSKGYVAGNIRVVCWWLNCACGVWGLKAIIPGMRAIVDRAPEQDV